MKISNKELLEAFEAVTDNYRHKEVCLIEKTFNSDKHIYVFTLDTRTGKVTGRDLGRGLLLKSYSF